MFLRSLRCNLSGWLLEAEVQKSACAGVHIKKTAMLAAVNSAPCLLLGYLCGYN